MRLFDEAEDEAEFVRADNDVRALTGNLTHSGI